MNQRARGMTLVEIMIALAIAALMTLTGWRAVDALQASRDRVVAEAQQWQRVDDLFVTLEADLRRASIREFIGTTDTITVLQPALDGGIDVQTVRYRLAAAPEFSTVSAVSATSNELIRESGNDRLPLAAVQSLNISYSIDGTAFEPSANTYPRAVRIVLLPVGADAPVERLLALR
jgi:prepilin-type N-terminal cleavage/methylation domain-containing protein